MKQHLENKIKQLKEDIIVFNDEDDIKELKVLENELYNLNKENE